MNEKNIIEYANERGYKSNATKQLPLFVAKKLVNINTLKIDTDYQRTQLTDYIIKRITKKFDFSLFTPVIVSLESKCILDGQHRVIGAYMAGVNQVPVNYVDVSKEEEPLYFVELNKRENAVKSIDKFKASVEGGVCDAVTIKNFIESIGLTIGNSGGNSSAKSVAFVTSILKFYRQYGEDIVFNALKIQKKICFFGLPERLNCYFYFGIVHSLRNGIKFGDNEIRKIIAHGGQTGYIKSFRVAQIKSMSYNRGSGDADIHVAVMNKIINSRKAR